MRKTKEIVADIIADVKDPAKLKLAKEFEDAQKEEDAKLEKLQKDNDELSLLARDAVLNGSANKPAPVETPNPANPQPKTIEEMIKEALTAKENKK
jgi:hypothetical protein